MGASEILSSILSRGYFPQELPPVFTTEDFGAHSNSILTEWKRTGIYDTSTKKIGKTSAKKKKRGSYYYVLPIAEAEILSKPKRGYERRNISITHPIPQALLTLELSEHWPQVAKWLTKQKYSEDDIRISSKYPRSIKGINFPLHRAKKAYLEANSDWVVKTDISRFYPSIYTHSITWAAYGKENVKTHISLYQGSLADRLDQLVRACNRNQTIGIPIGPETSRIIAEIISSTIDSEFEQLHPELSRRDVDRLQDDWTIGVANLEDAETALSSISNAYREFGLDINGSKTSIEHILKEKNNDWIAEIGAFLSHKGGNLSGSRLREFLNLSLRLQLQYRSEPIINYALTVVEDSSLQTTNVELIESFLLKASVVSPNSMDRICRIIVNLQFLNKTVSKERLVSRFSTLIERNLERGNDFEVIWLLYALRGLKCKLRSKAIVDMSEKLTSSVIILILLDMDSKGLLARRLPRSEWESLISVDRVKADWTWLMAYEGFRHGWLNDSDDLLSKPFFKAMHDRNVVFYDPKRNVRSSESFIRMQKQTRRRGQIAIRNLMNYLRGFRTSFDDFV